MNKVFVILAASALFGIGNALMCYECSDVIATMQSCQGFQKNSSFESNCSDAFNGCGKAVIERKSDKAILVSRQCVNLDDKPKICGTDDNYQKTTCHFCTKDLCNTAAIPSTVSSLVYILPIALFLITGSSK